MLSLLTPTMRRLFFYMHTNRFVHGIIIWFCCDALKFCQQCKIQFQKRTVFVIVVQQVCALAMLTYHTENSHFTGFTAHSHSCLSTIDTTSHTQHTNSTKNATLFFLQATNYQRLRIIQQILAVQHVGIEEYHSTWFNCAACG